LYLVGNKLHRCHSRSHHKNTSEKIYQKSESIDTFFLIQGYFIIVTSHFIQHPIYNTNYIYEL
jgi:hypothetical protein